MKETNVKIDWEKKYQLRQESNFKILDMIRSIAEKYPDWRFWQIMCNLGYETKPDRFYEESYDTMTDIENLFNEQYNK